MDKKSGSEGTGSKNLPNPDSATPETDSGQAGKGSNLFYVNEQGELCFGNACVSVRVKPQDGEVRVIVDRNECEIEIDRQFVDALFGEVVKGSPTVYESKTKNARQRQE
jgi:hypothetical protein